MSQPIKKPCFIDGTPRSSGDVQTGEIQHVRGGGRAFTNFSGTAAGNDVLIYSGAGRLNSILQHTQMQSGQTVYFYDSAIATSGGPFAASGHKIVGILPATWSQGAPGSGAINQQTGQPLNVDFPFQSGLVAATRSGTPGFSVSYTVENSIAFPSA